ncbi:MAG: flavin monoamine oxidase family protein [Thiohalomonadales bacterium]
MKRRSFIKTISALSAGLGVSTLSAGSLINAKNNTSANRDDELFDVAVIGAGLSGLVTARELKISGYKVVIIEAKSRVGGRTHNQLSRQGVIVDGGGQWIGPTQTEMMALANELGVTTFKTWNTGESLTLSAGQVYRESDIEPTPADIDAYLQAVALIDEMAFLIPLDAPWIADNAQALDAQLLSQWLLENVPSDSIRQEINGGVESILSAPSSQISLLWFLFYVHSGGGWERLQSIDNGAQESRFVGGSQLISNKIAAEMTENIILGSPVQYIEQAHAHVEIKLRFGEVKARRVIVAMMPADVTRIEFEPRLPVMRQALNDNWATASGVKVQVVYATPFWRGQGLSGIANTDTAVSSIFDNSPADSSYGVLLAFVEIDYLPVDAIQRQAEIIAVFETLFGQAASKPIDYLEMDWNKELYNSGCESPLAPGVLTAYGAALREPVGLIHWAGTETSVQWNGYMEGAVRSGKRAAQEVMSLL